MFLAAYKSGCEAVKHQTHIVDDEITGDANKIILQHTTESIWNIIKNSALSKDNERELKRYAESLGIIYLSILFSRNAVDFLEEISVDAYKIGSGECNYLPLINMICSMDPVELKYLIDRVAEIHSALAVEKGRSKDDSGTSEFAKSSIVVDRNLTTGQIIASSDIWAKRPGDGEICVSEYIRLIGKKERRDIRMNEQLSWDDFT